MATLSPPAAIQAPNPGQGGRGIEPPNFHGGGGDRRGGDGYPDYGQRLKRARLGLILVLVPIFMLFATVSVAYFLRLGLPNLDENGERLALPWSPSQLPAKIILVNTLLLILSSITAELARRQIKRRSALAPVLSIPGISLGAERDFPWLIVTEVLGIGFLLGQAIVWRELAARGFYLATNPTASFVYVLTATHAIHLAGGIAFLLYAGVISALNKPLEVRRIVIDVTAWYWHFMLFLWIYVLIVLELGRKSSAQ